MTITIEQAREKLGKALREVIEIFKEIGQERIAKGLQPIIEKFT